MSELLAFFDSHYVLAFFFMVFIYYLARAILFVLPNRIIRCVNMWKNGWPPTHCDADGDIETVDNEEPDEK